MLLYRYPNLCQNAYSFKFQPYRRDLFDHSNDQRLLAEIFEGNN